ncbi:putative neuraminidase [Gottschalkia acidurici 9a]|uniref:Neuraminidase n=1 Tax=Gottschalkia acidurici (strain ATCC 7906 / DSM 604 / BCRC 14475 / CIP 104303 / KCTC 5404 / NCIMB 10678 / 9a) TaxID=1128398 RepID=K0B0S4_GOTA9|nr:sialidase family protein [Gottschalkia acidurici]AFS78515.1 putative neuraminidase [Gottschalkia acidurici 9a]
MASTEKTGFLGLNQWVGSDKPKRQDFVDDNKKIDNRLKELNDKIVNSIGYGVDYGLDVKPQAIPDMTVNISSGVVYMPDGTKVELSEDISLTVNAADITNPRIDIVYIDANGNIEYLEGIPSPSPVAPAPPIGSLLLAEINVAANATAITSDSIVDKRKMNITIEEISSQVNIKVEEIESQVTDIANKVENISASDIEVRRELLRLESQLAREREKDLNLIVQNVSGLGMFDTFNTTEYVDMSTTTAKYNSLGDNFSFAINDSVISVHEDTNNNTLVSTDNIAIGSSTKDGAKILSVDSNHINGEISHVIDSDSSLNVASSSVRSSVICDDGMNYFAVRSSSNSNQYNLYYIKNGVITTKCVIGTNNTGYPVHLTTDGKYIFVLIFTSTSNLKLFAIDPESIVDGTTLTSSNYISETNGTLGTYKVITLSSVSNIDIVYTDNMIAWTTITRRSPEANVESVTTTLHRVVDGVINVNYSQMYSQTWELTSPINSPRILIGSNMNKVSILFLRASQFQAFDYKFRYNDSEGKYSVTTVNRGVASNDVQGASFVRSLSPIVRDSVGNYYLIAYCSRISSTGTGMHCLRSIDEGNSWHAYSTLDGSNNSVSTPSLTIDSNQRLTSMFPRVSGGILNRRIYTNLTTSTDNWTEPQMVTGTKTSGVMITASGEYPYFDIVIPPNYYLETDGIAQYQCDYTVDYNIDTYTLDKTVSFNKYESIPVFTPDRYTLDMASQNYGITVRNLLGYLTVNSNNSVNVVNNEVVNSNYPITGNMKILSGSDSFDINSVSGSLNYKGVTDRLMTNLPSVSYVGRLTVTSDGTIVVPIVYQLGTGWDSTVIYSRDSGITWTLHPSALRIGGVAVGSENFTMDVVEYNGNIGFAVTNISTDTSATWRSLNLNSSNYLQQVNLYNVPGDVTTSNYNSFFANGHVYFTLGLKNGSTKKVYLYVYSVQADGYTLINVRNAVIESHTTPTSGTVGDNAVKSVPYVYNRQTHTVTVFSRYISETQSSLIYVLHNLPTSSITYSSIINSTVIDDNINTKTIDFDVIVDGDTIKVVYVNSDGDMVYTEFIPNPKQILKSIVIGKGVSPKLTPSDTLPLRLLYKDGNVIRSMYYD